MGRITEELLRRRSEHNEGVLSTMEEVSLHQFELEKIENLDKFCRHLKILFLQNNIIEKFENLDKLKELEYLNIAVNNLSIIENLEGCESLNKLDLTLNFIDIEDLRESMINLRKVATIKELYLTGNPCESWEGFKEYVLASVPQLSFLNGTEIFKSDRIKADQNFERLEKELSRAAIDNIIKKESDPDKDNPNKYTKDYRRRLYKEMEEEKIEKENLKKGTNKNDDLPKEMPSVYKDDGEVRLCNQGRYEFYLDQDIYKTGITTFELKLPKFLDTTNIIVDLNPQYIRVEAKKKVTQLRFDHEIIVEKSTIQRSTTTGHLLIKAPIYGFVPKSYLSYNDKSKENNLIKNEKNKKEAKPMTGPLITKNNINSANKVGNIDLVNNIESQMIGNVAKEADKIDYSDIDLNEIPDLD